jgi:hypothetical protein
MRENKSYFYIIVENKQNKTKDIKDEPIDVQ